MIVAKLATQNYKLGADVKELAAENQVRKTENKKMKKDVKKLKIEIYELQKQVMPLTQRKFLEDFVRKTFHLADENIVFSERLREIHSQEKFRTIQTNLPKMYKSLSEDIHRRKSDDVVFVLGDNTVLSQDFKIMDKGIRIKLI